MESRVIIRSPAARTVLRSRGAPGPSGAEASGFVHVQSVEADEWIVNHNLGRKPQVSVLNIAGAEVEADARHITDTQLRVYFAAPAVGSVLCN